MVLPLTHIPMLIFGIISLSLYVIIIVTLIRFRQNNSALRGSFFTMVIVHAISDIMMFFAFNILMRARKFGFFWLFDNNPTEQYIPSARFTIGLHYYLKIVMYIGHTGFAANRLTATKFPLSYEAIWTPPRLCVYWILQWCLPMVLIVPIVSDCKRKIEFVYWLHQDTLRLETDHDTTQFIALIDGSACLLATCICIVLYTIIFIEISTKLRKNDVQRAYMVEMRLMFASFIVFIIFFLNTIAQLLAIIYTYWDRFDIVMILNDLTYPLMDAFCMAQPWALFITSAVLRNAIFGLVSCKRDDSTSVQSSSSAQYQRGTTIRSDRVTVTEVDEHNDGNTTVALL